MGWTSPQLQYRIERSKSELAGYPTTRRLESHLGRGRSLFFSLTKRTRSLTLIYAVLTDMVNSVPAVLSALPGVEARIFGEARHAKEALSAVKIKGGTRQKCWQSHSSQSFFWPNEIIHLHRGKKGNVWPTPSGSLRFRPGVHRHSPSRQTSTGRSSVTRSTAAFTTFGSI